MNDDNPDPAWNTGADEVSRIPESRSADVIPPVLNPPRESRMWMLAIVIIVLAIAGLLVTPMIRQQGAERERVKRSEVLLAKAQDQLIQGHLEAAEYSAREAMKLVPKSSPAEALLREVGALIEERTAREQGAEIALAAAEQSVDADEIIRAIKAYEGIIGRSAEFPEAMIGKAKGRLAALRESTGTLVLPPTWPGDALITMDGVNQTPAQSMITGIPFGSRAFEFSRKGFRPPPRIEIKFSGVRPVTLPNILWKPKGGKVTIASTPSGAEVWNGQENTGRVTPATFEDVEVGTVEYTLKLPRHANAVVRGEVPSEATLALAADLIETISFPMDGKMAGERRVFNVGPDLRIPFRWCPPGTFTMGGSDRSATRAEKPVRKVTLTAGFWLGETEFTQKQWAAIEGRESLLLKLSRSPRSTKPIAKNQDLPLHSVSWEHICGNKARTGGVLGKINAYLHTNKVTQWTADLPTEAQWEYACRAGTNGPFAIGDPGVNIREMIGWHSANSGGVVHPVGLKQPNPWGFHDMHGNIREWTRDWYQNSYAKLPATNPSGPRSGWKIAVRGGSFLTSLTELRSSARAQAYSSISHHSVGFRLILRKPEKAPPKKRKK